MSIRRTFLIATIPALLLPAAARAQSVPDNTQDELPAEQAAVSGTWRTDAAPPLVMTLDEAIQIALVRNRSIKSARLEIDRAGHQVREGWAELLPQVDLNSQYTRNVRSVNPFAGSEAGGFFNTLGFIDWLAYNEQARTDEDPGSAPISLEEFFDRQAEGRREAGIQAPGGGDNPFSVPNVYRTGLTVTQALFDGRAAFGAIGASKWLVPMNRNAVDRQEQLLVQQVKQAWYGALLATEREKVLEQSVDRADDTMREIARQVAQGVTPKFQRLSAEVELANIETEYVQAANAADRALDDLKLTLGIPVEQPVSLRGDLRNRSDADLMNVSVEQAASIALQNRPDLEGARINIELQEIQLRVTRAEYLPTIDAFANLNYVGNVPDNRLSISTDPDDPFSYSSVERGYFDSAYWDYDFNVGFSLTWNLFNGFASRQRVQQNKINVQQAELEHEQLIQDVRAEVEGALRDLRASHTRMISQERNVARAELNYSYAQTRLEEGVAAPLEVREASEQLDQTHINYLQAVHDFLVARTAYEAATGTLDETVMNANITSN